MARRTRRSSERAPADSLRDKFNVIGGWLPSLTFAFGDTMMRVLILSLVCLLIGCSSGVLPSERALLELEDAKLRDMVLQHVPLGSPRKAVEQTFSQSFEPSREKRGARELVFAR